MKIKYSALVSATSGKLNGSVAASNRGGAYLRNKGVTSNPQTVSQQANRSLFGSISSQFRNLTSAQIIAWNNAAQDFPVIDRFGDTRYLSGLALYVQLNKNLSAIGAPTISNPPSKVSFPAITNVVAEVTVDGGSWDTFSVDVIGATAFSADYYIQLRATPPLSPSINFVKNRLRDLGNAPGVGTTTISFGAESVYQNVFGIPAAGTKIAFEVAIVSAISGEKTAPFIVEVLVTEAA